MVQLVHLLHEPTSIETLIGGVFVGFISFGIILGNEMFLPKHNFE
jgi:hypothetical protein